MGAQRGMSTEGAGTKSHREKLALCELSGGPGQTPPPGSEALALPPRMGRLSNLTTETICLCCFRHPPICGALPPPP